MTFNKHVSCFLSVDAHESWNNIPNDTHFTLGVEVDIVSQNMHTKSLTCCDPHSAKKYMGITTCDKRENYIDTIGVIEQIRALE